MEHPLAKVREKDDKNNDDDVCSDRISRLPDPVLHHILCFLSQKKAVQTSWRHLGPTRPVIELRGGCRGFHLYKVSCEICFYGNEEAFTPVLEKTFQRYHHQNLFTQELRLPNIMGFPSKSIPVLEKWIPIMFAQPNVCLNALHISFHSWTAFDPPSPVFKVESLRELHLEGCRLINHITNSSIVELNNLQNLSLYRVDISDEALEKVISGCPLVKRVVLYDCRGLKTIGIGHKNRYLDYFEFNWNSVFGDETVTSIEIDPPTIQTIRIRSSSNWYRNHESYFPRLKSLFLLRVNLPTESFENISCNFPCLEELTLDDCSGFEEIELYSRSINHLIINQLRRSSNKKVAIEVPSIRYFEFSTSSLSTTLSVTTTSSREWKSHLYLHCCLLVCGNNNVLPRILKLFEMVKALRQSQISLRLSETFQFKMNRVEWDFNDHPVELEHLVLKIGNFSPDTLTHFSNALFRIFRPRYANAMCSYRKYYEEVTEFLWKTLIHDREKTRYGWEQHLEEVSIEASDENEEVWQHVEGTCLPKRSKDQKIRFRLKWRD